jgi:exosortase E/protease (VPEID-CTERM system)
MSPSSSSFLIRGLFLLAVLTLEVIWITYRFDFNITLGNQHPDPATQLIKQASLFLRVMAAFAGSALIIFSPRLMAIFRDMRNHQATHPWRLWLLAHGLVFSGFALVSAFVYAALIDSENISAALLAGWIILGGSTLGLWLIALAPFRFWRALAHREYVSLLLGGVAGLVSGAAAQLSQSLWQSFTLAEMTLWLVHRMLGLIYSDVAYDAGSRILGTPYFQVDIAPQCSGYEGISLITAFLAVYLWAFRARLRFPRALWLFPLGILAIWLANVGRITLLVALGTSFSSDIAIQGFHSQAGWITFILVAFGLIALSHRRQFFMAAASKETKGSMPQNASMAAALVTPLLALLMTAMFISALSSGFELLYPLKVVVIAAVLYHFRRVYSGLDWEWSWPAMLIGIAVFLMWMLLEPATGNDKTALAKGLEELPAGLAAAWLAFRVLGSTITIPLAEELAFRGYLIHKLIRTDFENVRPGQFTWPSFLVSSVLFGLLHGRWLAGTLAGMGFALALYRRGRLADAIVAHITANALIAACVLYLANWSLWS